MRAQLATNKDAHADTDVHQQRSTVAASRADRTGLIHVCIDVHCVIEAVIILIVL